MTVRVLLDECVDPKAARYFSQSFDVKHVRDMGWLGTKNGELVRRAAQDFDVLLTIDTNMRHQTSLRGLNLAVVVATGHFRTLADFQRPIERMEQVRASVRPGEFFVLD